MNKTILITIVILSFIHILDCVGKASRGSFPDETDPDFLNECIYFHNQLRKKHSSPDLKMDASLVKYSMGRLKNMTKFEKLSFYGHADLDQEYGENIYRSVGKIEKSTCEAAVKSWYDEIKDYDFAKSEFNSKTGHFTQLIWAETKTIGCARSVIKAKGKKNKFEIYIVCNYKDMGNVSGEFKKNVKKQSISGKLSALFGSAQKELAKYKSKFTKDYKKEFDKLKSFIKTKSNFSDQKDGKKG